MLLTVDQEVDWNLEAGCIATMMQRVGGGRYTFLFNNVKGYKDKGRLTTCLYAPPRRHFWERYALIMGLPRDIGYFDFKKELVRRMDTKLKPIELAPAEAVCKENVRLGKEVNLLELPIPFVHGSDGGRYLTNHYFVVEDPDTGWVNVALYRFMVKSPRRGGALWTMGQQSPTIHLAKYEPRGMILPWSIGIGGDPALFMAITMAAPPGVCEYDIAGGFRGEPMELTRCETNNLLVPANAEVVLEGEARPGERMDEGPFGEYSGFTHGRNVSPIFRVNCVTHRNNPIVTFFCEGAKWGDSESALLNFTMASVDYLERGLGLPVVDMVSDRDASWGFYPIAIDLEHPEQVRELFDAAYAWKSTLWCFYFSAHDPDVDTRDMRDVIEDIGINSDPRFLKEYTSDLDCFMHPLDFFTDVENRFRGTDAAKTAYDCTKKFKPWKYPRKDTFENAYPAEVVEKTKAMWTELGFDEPFELKEAY
jgi:4-hydroxy-3-polyprenylbenzoate decarboxylase